MNIKTLTVKLLLITVLGTMLVMPATAATATATRTLPGDCVGAGEDFTVTIKADDYGSTCAVIETLCSGWEYQGTTADDVQVNGNVISFMLVGGGPKTFTYTVSAPDATGACCDISGIIRDFDTHDHTVTGTTEVRVCGDPISVIRDISAQTVEAGSTFTVTLTLTTNKDIQAPALKENLPAGWTVKSVLNSGATYKPDTNEWIWTTAMSSGGTKTVIYEVTVPAGAASQDYGIAGQASAHDVSPVAIGGESKVIVEPVTTVDPISAARDISDQTVEPGSTFKVTLTLTAKDDIQAPALDENLPTGWTVTAVDNGGATYKAATTEWIWTTAMSSGGTKTVVYDVTVPAGAASQDYDITGQASAHDVSPVAIGGDSKVTVGTVTPPPPTATSPPPTTSEIPILTSSGICALIAVLGIAGASMIVNRGRKR